jgi:nitrite reductase (NO-forming)
MFTRYVLLAGIALASFSLTAPALSNDLSKLPRKQVQLVPPPFVHPHEQATKEGPKIVQFRMTVQEKEMVIDDAGTKVHAMTFDGSVPGPMMVVHR